MNIFQEILYRPLFNLLIYLYNTIAFHDLGIAIVLLTLLVKLLLYSLSRSSIESQKAMTEIQPKIKELQEQYKNNKEKQAVAIFDLYKTYKVNPFSSFLTLLIQIPLLIALYQVFLNGSNMEKMKDLYSFIQAPAAINTIFVGWLNLSQPSVILAILAAGLSFIQMRMMTPKVKKETGKSDFMNTWSEQMVFMAPIMTLIIAIKFPAGLALYWTTITLFSIIQQYLVLKQTSKKVA